MTKMFPPHRPKSAAPLRGYIEGYYGRLLRWDDRMDILSHMATLGMDAYLYAPKEDPCHRHDWRRAYDDDWQSGFTQCCHYAERHGMTMIGGIAPGLDYDYRQINTGDDWHKTTTCRTRRRRECNEIIWTFIKRACQT